MALPLAERAGYRDRRVVNPLHRVRPKSNNRPALAVRADVLAELLEVFRRHFIVLTLRRLSRS
jgi:hypothetical protein